MPPPNRARGSRNSGPCPRRICSADSGQRLRACRPKMHGRSCRAAARGSARPAQGTHVLSLLFGQFKSPIILILVFAAVLSLCLGQATDALIILAIVLASGLLGFWQEWGAADAVKKLLALVQTKANVLRDGRPVDVPAEQVVPGDVVLLHAGDIIPGDGRVLDESDLFVAEASLTGETFPVEKAVGVVPSDAPLGRRTNCVFLGTSVVSGTARLLVVRTGRDTEFGRISGSLRLRPPETGFERGIRRFGYLLLEVTLLLVLAIFAINVALHRPVLESFLFSVAIAVGLTPQLLPAIISVNLAHGARRMARERVIVRRLASIENLGGMDVFCSDKTGTLTEGKVRLHAVVDAGGKPSERTGLYAYLNASFQAGYSNPIDEAIVAGGCAEATGYRKLDEEPYDFVRKRLSVLVAGGGKNLLVTKGALANVLEVCTTAEAGPGDVVDLDAMRPQIERLFAEFSGQGFRTLGVAYREMGSETGIHKGHESEMTFLGLLVLDDPLKAGIAATLKSLLDLGIATKLITGDNRLVAAHIAGQAGLRGGTHPDRGGPATDERRGVAPACRRGRRLRRGRAEPERADHPGLEAGRPRRRLHGGRDQRRFGPARRRRRHLGGRRGGRGQGGSRFRAAGEGPGGPGARRAGGPGHFRQHDEVYLHGNQRQLRQHVQHGRGLAVPDLPAAACPSRSCW